MVQRSFSKGRGNFPNLFTDCESEKMVQTEPDLYTIFTTGFSVEENVACCLDPFESSEAEIWIKSQFILIIGSIVELNQIKRGVEISLIVDLKQIMKLQ